MAAVLVAFFATYIIADEINFCPEGFKLERQVDGSKLCIRNCNVPCTFGRSLGCCPCNAGEACTEDTVTGNKGCCASGQQPPP